MVQMGRLCVVMSVMVSLIQVSVKADQPPSFESFEIQSANRHFGARVQRKGAVKNLQGVPDDWMLEVFRIQPDGTSSPLWRSPFDYSGYPGGLVSDDGKCVVVVSVWYNNDRPVIDFYREGKRIKSIKGQEIKFDRSKLKNTVSHQLWLMDDGAVDGRSTELTGDTLHLRTIDQREHRFNLRSGKRLP